MRDSLSGRELDKFVPLLREYADVSTHNTPVFSLVQDAQDYGMLKLSGSFEQVQIQPMRMEQYFPGSLMGHETIGSHGETRFTVVTEPHAITRHAWGILSGLENTPTLTKARQLLEAIDEILLLLSSRDFDLYSYPPITVSFDNGAILFDWVYDHFQIGFTIELDVEKSNWHIISDAVHGDITASAFLPRENLKSLLLWIIFFVAVNPPHELP